MKAAADAIRANNPKLGSSAEVYAYAALLGYITERAKQAFASDFVMTALSDERPWGLIRLLVAEKMPEMALNAMFPVLADVAQQIDPEGNKRFFDYSRDDIARLVEVIVYVWEECQGGFPSVSPVVPYAHVGAPPPEPAHKAKPYQPAPMPSVQPQQRPSATILEDDIPF